MKKGISLILILLLVFTGAAAGATVTEEEIDLDDLLEIGEVEVEEIAAWNFPLALEDMNPEYIVLANKHYLLDPDYVPEDLVLVPNNPAKGGIWHQDAGQDLGGRLKGHHMREEAANALCEMNQVMRAMKETDGFQNMYLKSGFRSYGKQKTMYDRRLKKNNGKDDGWVSQPGASDHQTGLGCDVVPNNWKGRGMNEKMMKEEECQWMAAHCQEYGFIIRYPEDKKEITEINTEPWHLRYVGVPVATYIMENGLCLEEFTEQLQAAIREYLDKGGDPERVEAYIQTPTDGE